MKQLPPWDFEVVMDDLSGQMPNLRGLTSFDRVELPKSRNIVLRIKHRGTVVFQIETQPEGLDPQLYMTVVDGKLGVAALVDAANRNLEELERLRRQNEGLQARLNQYPGEQWESMGK